MSSTTRLLVSFSSFVLVAGCGASGESERPDESAERDRGLEPSDPPPPDESSGEGDCAATWPDDAPDWAIRAGAPVSVGEDIEGTWRPVVLQPHQPEPSVPPGPLRAPVGCYSGYEALRLSRSGERVVVAWSFRRATGGAIRIEETVVEEKGEGVVRGGVLRLTTTRRTTHHHRDRPDHIDVGCSEHRYELRIDPATGHLVGTIDGRPIYLRPWEVLAQPQPCGPPPP